MQKREFDLVLVTFTLCSLIFGILTVFWGTAILFDGSFFTLYLSLQKGFTNEFIYSRRVAHWLTEYPVILYAKYGANQVKTLVRLYGALLVIHPVLSAWICRWVLPDERKDFVVYPIISFCAVTITSYYFQVDELNIAHSLAWILACILQNPIERMTIPKLVSASLLGVVISFSYPLLFPAGLLLAGVLLSQKTSTKSGYEKKIFLSIWMIGCAAFSAWVAHHYFGVSPWLQRIYWNIFKYWNFHLTTWEAVVAGVFMLLAQLFLNRSRLWVIVGIAIGSVLWLASVRDGILGYQIYDGRTLAGFSFAVVLALAISLERFRKSASAVALGVLILAFGTEAVYLKNWIDFQDHVLSATEKFRGLTSYDDFIRADPEFKTYCTDWNATPFTILIQHLRGREVRAIVLQSERSPDKLIDFWGGKDKLVHDLRDRGVRFETF